jgi:hypothetical protein
MTRTHIHAYWYSHTHTHIYIYTHITTKNAHVRFPFYAPPAPPAIPTNAAVMTGVAAKTELTMPLNA